MEAWIPTLVLHTLQKFCTYEMTITLIVRDDDFEIFDTNACSGYLLVFDKAIVYVID